MIAVEATSATVRPQRVDPSIGLVQMPAGFAIDVFAEGLEQPRVIVAAPGGLVYVAERRAGQVRLLRDTDGDGRADVVQVVKTGLRMERAGVHGLAVREGRLYMVTERELASAPIAQDGTLGDVTIHAADLPSGGQHPNRTIAFGPDGALYLSIGSTCNACAEPNPEHATLSRVDLATGERTVIAKGLRNTIGFGWHPVSRELYGLDHNSDARGDDWPPEELNRIVEGRNYGWPWCGGAQEIDFHVAEDPPMMQDRATYCGATEAPVLELQAHIAPMQLVYYTGSQFPAEYQGDAFVTLRGSWNRNPPVGYEVMRVLFDERGVPTGTESFIAGWLRDDGRAQMGRLMGLAQAEDGSLLVGDDEHGIIYRVRYDGQ